MENFITVAQSAKILGCSIRQVYKYIDGEKLKKYIAPRTGFIKLDKKEVDKLSENKPIKSE